MADGRPIGIQFLAITRQRFVRFGLSIFIPLRHEVSLRISQNWPWSGLSTCFGPKLCRCDLQSTEYIRWWWHVLCT